MKKFKTKKQIQGFLDVCLCGACYITRETTNNPIKKYMSYEYFSNLFNVKI